MGSFQILEEFVVQVLYYDTWKHETFTIMATDLVHAWRIMQKQAYCGKRRGNITAIAPKPLRPHLYGGVI